MNGRAFSALAVLVVAIAVSACTSNVPAPASAVHSVVADPNADPHEYESSTTDARAFAEADLVILNGAGYDDWGQKLLDANSSSHRTVLDIAQLLGRTPGDNPHFWYDPASVLT